MPTTSRRSPTLHDVAARAGVSHTTVSRVLHGSNLVAPATAGRVETAIRDLDYVLNTSAQALAYRRQIVGSEHTDSLVQPLHQQDYDRLIKENRRLRRELAAAALEQLRSQVPRGAKKTRQSKPDTVAACVRAPADRSLPPDPTDQETCS